MRSLVSAYGTNARRTQGRHRVEPKWRGNTSGATGECPTSALSHSETGTMSARATRWIQAHALMATNALSLYGSTIVTSLLGFAFWWAASHKFSASEVGGAAASISAMQMLATACILGLNTLLIGELPRRKEDAGTLIATSVSVVACVSLVISLVVSVLLSRFSTSYGEVFGTAAAIALFAIGTVLTAVTIVLDDACIGLFAGQIQLWRNAVFSAVKLALVPCVFVLLPARHGLGLVLAWVVATLVSMWWLRPLLKVRAGKRFIDLRLVKKHASLALRHHWLNVSLQSPRLLLPVIAVPIIGTAHTAGYFMAATIVGFVGIIPFHFSTVLFALDPGDEKKLTHEVRFTLTVSAVVAVVSAPIIAVAAPLILGAFKPSYTEASAAFALLALTTLPTAVKAHYIAIARVRGQLLRAAVTTMIGSGVEVVSAAVGGAVIGLSGLALGILVGQVMEAIYFAPPVVSAFRGNAAKGEMPRRRRRAARHAVTR